MKTATENLELASNVILTQPSDFDYSKVTSQLSDLLDEAKQVVGAAAVANVLYEKAPECQKLVPPDPKAISCELAMTLGTFAMCSCAGSDFSCE